MSRVIDPRGKMVCNLGPMIRGGTSRDHVKDAWLLRHAGEIEVARVIAPSPGTRVELGYQWRGGFTRFPVRHYVLGASTSPYGRTTIVRIGCRITLMADRAGVDPVRAEETPPEWYSELNEEQQLDATSYVTAQSVLEQCAAGMGTSIASGSYQLVGNLLTDSVSLSNGYANVMADLLKSHCCVGYLNPADQIEVRKIDLRRSGGPMFDERYIIELNPINGTDAGAESITVTYDAVVADPTRGEGSVATPPAPVMASTAPGLTPTYWGQIGEDYSGKGAVD